MDPLFRGRDSDHIPGGTERVRSGAGRGRDSQPNAREPPVV